MEIMEIAPLLPDAASLEVRGIENHGKTITLKLASRPVSCECPVCRHRSARVHSHYVRHLGDLPWQGTNVRIELHVRKLFCNTPSCPRRIFTECLPHVVARYGRRTQRLAGTLRALGMALGGEPGARMAGCLAMPTSPDTLLRLVCTEPLPRVSTPRVLGVDDWSWHRGQRYGTILCDLERHRPLDLLPDRSAELLTDWLARHPGVKIISRDRSGVYAKGAAAGAPHARQVADRFHLLKNLRKALVRLLTRLPRELKDAVAAGAAALARPHISPVITGKTADHGRAEMLPVAQPVRSAARSRRLERYNAVMQLHREGMSARQIALRLRLDRETVGHFIHSEGFPERSSRSFVRRTDPFKNYLRRRWLEGCQNGTQLYREIHEQGFRGSPYCVKRTLLPWRREKGSTVSSTPAAIGDTPPLASPSPNQIAWWLMRPAKQRSASEAAAVRRLTQRCRAVRIATRLVHAFMDMLKHRRFRLLEGWKRRVRRPDVPKELRVFADGLDQDGDAVTAALRLKWSNGQVEGQINRLKLLKRQMYGRAGFDLLRHRVLHAS